MDFKWTLSRPGIELEFETGSISEAIGLLEEEGTKIADVFGFTMGAHAPSAAPPAPANDEPTTTAEPAQRRTRGPNKPKAAVEAIAPEPLPVPTLQVPPGATVGTILGAVAPPILVAPPLAPTATALPPNALNGANLAIPVDGGIPTFLLRAPAAPPPPLPLPTAPPVGLLGPKVVKALDLLKEGKPDGGQALSDWLAGAGLTIKGKSYDEACRAVLMISDAKILEAGVLQPLGLS